MYDIAEAGMGPIIKRKGLLYKRTFLKDIRIESDIEKSINENNYEYSMEFLVKYAVLESSSSDRNTKKCSLVGRLHFLNTTH